MKRILLLTILAVYITFWGCTKKVETIKQNQRLILVCEPYEQILQMQAEQYNSLYPNNMIEVKGSTTREAIVHLLNDSVNSIVIDRKFNEEETQVIQSAKIKVTENVIAKDGIAIIVNKKHPISEISVETVKRIVSTEIKEWKQVPNCKITGKIDFTITERNTGMYEIIQKYLLGAEKKIDATTVLTTQQEVIGHVSKNLYSIGFVASSQAVNSKDIVKILPVITISETNKKAVYLPGQQEIYATLYPFHYSLYLYNTEAKVPSGIGFSAFVLSNIGQTLIQKTGLVPVSIPYRTIQLTTE